MSDETCEWCNQPIEIDYWVHQVKKRYLHDRCFALMWNYARRFQELKELLMQPDFVEMPKPEAASP
jgi:hypothetical protein